MSYKYLKAPGDLMTADMAWHKNNGTSGEDWIWKNIEMSVTTQMTKPCSDLKYIGNLDLSDGSYKEFYHGTMNGYKFSCYTCHCKDFVTTGDNYKGSTGLHIHLLCFHGHQTIDYMQQNRNTKGVTLAEIDAKCLPQSTSTPPTKTVKGYSFKKCSSNNGASFFPIEEYGSTQDDLCFNIENIKKLSSGAYDLIKTQHDYQEHTQFKEIKTTFYTDGTKSSGSSSTATPTKHKYKRTHGDDQGYYEIEDKYMNGLKVIGTTSDKYPCRYSTDNKIWTETKIVGTTTMDVKL